MVVHDLSERVPIAERESLPEVLLFGTPAAEPSLAAGFFPWAGGTGDRFVWARREVELSLELPAPAPRAAVLDLRAFEGVPEQSVRVLLNGQEVARSAVAPQRQRVWLPLPEQAQAAGENRLRFEFAGTASTADLDKASSDGGQLAAAFYSLVVGPESDGSLVELLGRDAPRPFSRTDAAGVPSTAQLGASSVRHVLALPAAAELRFRAELHPAAAARGGIARASVSVESPGGREQELWARTLLPGDAFGEASLRLPGLEGETMALTFRVSGERSPWVVWKAPRVLGRIGEGAAPRAAVGPRAERLRAALAGKSVVFVILDAARARQLGCYGYSRETTPELDRLAREGVLFENAYTPAAYTVGAMSSIWTSQQPDEHHDVASFEARLPSDRLTLAELLSANGVQTAGFVANAMAGRALGFERGFQEFHELYGDAELGSRAEIFRKAVPEWLSGRRNGGRFFLYLHFREPHFPYDPPPPFRARFGPDAPLPLEASRERDWYVSVNQGETKPSAEEIEHLVRLYDANLAYVDREVGELRRALEAAGLLEQVLLVVTADHGEQLYEHGYISHSAQVYEDSLHVPLIVRFPAGTGPARVRVPGLVDHTDIAPTIADAFGVLGRGGSARSFAGRSLLDVLSGGDGRAAVVSRSVWERPLYAVRGRRFKLIRDTRGGGEELYDLARDPGETSDLLAAEPLRAARLRQQLHAFMTEVRSRPARAVEKVTRTPEQRENMCALGYLDACK